MISPEDYIEQRLNDQINWYGQKSSTNQLWFKRRRFAYQINDAGFLDGEPW